MTLAQRIGNYSSPTSLGSRLRRRRIGPLLDMVAAVSGRKGSCSILDVGGTRKYWTIVPTDFLLEHRVTVLIANIGDTGVSSAGDPEGVFRYAQADACALPYDDRSFDIAHSNSVIEHVGPWEQQANFAREIDRVAGAYFVQTPNFWFPWEPHFGTLGFQFMPVPVRVRMLMKRQRGFRAQMRNVDDAIRSVESCQLLDERRFRALFPEAEMLHEKFAGLTKSLIAIRRPPHR
ncbi:MAG: class I SAM-dependent methyltransferase [Alphaproteobacteria bacterium]|nr:class I SAM-dependent methyltransferase [Alphaproteobacteria bacterium]